MKELILYTRNPCLYCDKAKYLLNARSIPFKVFDLTQDEELLEKLSKTYHWKTVPMIFIGDYFVGGFRELSILDKEGKLQDLLKS